MWDYLNVDNTSDVNKSISTATQTALDGKVSKTGNETIEGLKTFANGIIRLVEPSGKLLDIDAYGS